MCFTVQFFICDAFYRITTSYITTICGHRVMSSHTLFVHLCASPCVTNVLVSKASGAQWPMVSEISQLACSVGKIG